MKDLVALALVTRMEPREHRTVGPTAQHMRWVAKNRDKWNAYRREWYRRRKGMSHAA